LRFIVDTLTHLPPGSKVRDEFKKGRRSKVAAVVSHAKTCDMWQMLLREDHRKGLGDQRELRRVAIEERLSELGYEREVEFLRPAMVDMTLRELDHGFTKIKGEALLVAERCSPNRVITFSAGVKDSKDLTARQWNNMLQRGEIVAYMRDEIRPKRIRVEWMEALRARVVVLARLLPPVASAGYSVVPRVVDLHNFEAFRAVLEQPLEEGEVCRCLLVTPHRFNDTAEHRHRELLRRRRCRSPGSPHSARDVKDHRIALHAALGR
jgi:hypothetical protein